MAVMNGIAFTVCLLCGLDQCEMEEMVIRACVEQSVPRKLWRKDVQAEIRHQKADNTDLGLEDYLCGPWYHCSVNLSIRSQLLDERWSEEYTWSFEERLWVATRGEFGEVPAAWKRFVLAKLVRNIGRGLPKLVREGVPRDRRAEKIGRPR
jgi:hypothetical protein